MIAAIRLAQSALSWMKLRESRGNRSPLCIAARGERDHHSAELRSLSEQKETDASSWDVVS